VESELFGHEVGAFTGAARRRLGRFELAHQGSLFLDEIGLIPLEVQEKILRAVEYGRFERVGGETAVEVDARLIGATNADLRSLVAAGRFKADLLDRLSFEVLSLPPLRERHGDVALLAGHFAARMAGELGLSFRPRFSAAALAALEAHPWPGNVRELKNVVERAVYRAEGEVVTEIIFDPFGPSPAAAAAVTPLPSPLSSPEVIEADPLARPFEETMRSTEVRLIKTALGRVRFNQRRAAVLLGLTYDQFRGLLKKHGGLAGLAEEGRSLAGGLQA
jgi:psp operon transcriptional activator